jgi:GTPase SAR1 family protein
MYFRGAQVALVVYSITDAASFGETDVWVRSLKENADPSCIIFLVGNKCDMQDLRAVPTDEGENKAREFAEMFYEVSAKTGDRIEELFRDVCKKYLEGKQPCLTPPGPAAPLPQKKGCCQ